MWILIDLVVLLFILGLWVVGMNRTQNKFLRLLLNTACGLSMAVSFSHLSPLPQAERFGFWLMIAFPLLALIAVLIAVLRNEPDAPVSDETL